jgi:hypothetical protein
MSFKVARPGLAVAALFAALVPLGACGLNFSNQAQAHDQWKRNYTLSNGGTVEIRNTNGKIDVQPGDGNTVEIVADRTVSASSDEAAKDGLSKFDMAETTSPNHIIVDSSNRGSGILIGISRRVDYQIRLPRWANVTLQATNGDISASGVEGAFRVETTNGRVNATSLGSSATVTSTNGAITLDFAKLGADGIRCETTNGMIAVTVPRDAKASISARVTNGAIVTEGLNVAVTEQSRRLLDGTIGGGGPSIRLETTNGAVRVSGR